MLCDHPTKTSVPRMCLIYPLFWPSCHASPLQTPFKGRPLPSAKQVLCLMILLKPVWYDWKKSALVLVLSLDGDTTVQSSKILTKFRFPLLISFTQPTYRITMVSPIQGSSSLHHDTSAMLYTNHIQYLYCAKPLAWSWNKMFACKSSNSPRSASLSGNTLGNSWMTTPFLFETETDIDSLLTLEGSVFVSNIWYQSA